MNSENATESIYAFVRSKGRAGATLREIQRALDFSSPSSALYHLGKLQSEGILTKDQYGKYLIKKKMGTQLDRSFLFLRSIFIPRHAPHALVMTVASVVYLVALAHFLSSSTTWLAIAPNIGSSAIFWYETIQELKMKPRFPLQKA